MNWRLAPSLLVLRAELNQRWPNRDRSSDGAIGDMAHAATASDHNPNAQGVVCAYDIDTDLDGTDDSSDPEMDALVEHLRTHPHPNLAMIIYRKRIATREAKYGYPAWAWRPYTKDPHISHPHLSVGRGPEGHRLPGTYDDTTPWLSGFGANAPLEDDELDKRQDMLLQNASDKASLAVDRSSWALGIDPATGQPTGKGVMGLETRMDKIEATLADIAKKVGV